MSKTTAQLRSLKIGKSGRVRGQDVKRDGDRYLIGGEEFSLEEAVKLLEQTTPAKSGFDYDWTVFVESPPGADVFPIKHHRCRDRAHHAELLEAVKKRKNYLWYGTVQKVDGKYQTRPPFLIDWDSVPDHHDETKTEKVNPKDQQKWDGGLSCPFCAKSVHSTQGRTLHIKSQHLERLEEYQALLAKKVSVKKFQEDDEDDVVSRQAECDDGLRCPFCQAKVNSTSGRTLHVRSKHPDQLSEYQRLLIGGKL